MLWGNNVYSNLLLPLLDDEVDGNEDWEADCLVLNLGSALYKLGDFCNLLKFPGS